MEPDEEPEPGSSSQSQNLHDLQNYLVTFNKDIGSGDDVLPNMDVDTGVGDVTDLYGTSSENPLQESGDTVVSSQFSSGFYSEQGMLDSTLSDESAHQIQTLVGPGGADGDSELSDIKQEVGGINLEAVSAQIAGFGDTHLSHAIPGIQTSSLSQGLIMTPLGDSIMTNQGKVLSIVSLGGEDGQFLSLADGQQMQIINSEDLGLTTDGLDTGESSLDIASTSSILTSNNADSPIPLAQLSTSTGDVAHTSGININPVQSNGGASSNLITTTANTAGASLLNSGLGQLVSLQGAGEGGQSQLVSLPGDAIPLQMQGLLGGEAINGDLAYQTITIMPSDLSQSGEMNYVLILAQPEGEKESVASVAQVYDLKQENQDFSEDMVDENGDTKRLLRFVPKKMVTHLGNQQLMCAYCNYTSPKRYLLTRHMRSHSDERPFKCESCDRGFKTSASLLNHVNTHTGTRPHKCKTCEAAFTTSGELVRHIRYRHTFEKPHRCPECDYASVELSKLKRHMRSHTGERPYKCSHCPYASPDTYKLKRHMRIHTGEKPYECDHCHARFTQSNSLKAHKLIHTGNKPVYQCSLCPTTCGRKTDLKIHFNKLHSAGLPLECRKCGKTYSDRYSYKQHVRTHDVDKCYKCEHCNFIATNEKSMEAHTLVQCGKHRCDECNTTFSSQKQYDKHVTLLHPNRVKLDTDDKTLNDSGEHFVSTVDKDPPAKLESSQPRESQIGQADGASGSQVIITPLASDTLHKNLIQDIKEGKLGDVPQVVIVHPDGSQEEISSKLTSDRWNVQDDFPPVAANEASTKSENVHGDKALEMSSDSITNDSIVVGAESDALLNSTSSKEEDGPESLEGQEGELYNQNESSQHCEAATQVEIDSDADSSSESASLDCGPQGKGQKEGSGPDTSPKNSLLVSDLTQVLKTSTSGSSLYLKTVINTSSGKKSITSLASSVLKVTQVNNQPNSSSTGGSRSHQYSLLSSSANSSVNSDSINNSKASSSLNSDNKNTRPKVFLSLSGIGGESCEPPVQLLAGDLNLALPLPSMGSDQGDAIQMLDLGELQPSSSPGLSHGEMNLDMDENSMGVKEGKGSEPKNTSSTAELLNPLPSVQRSEECHLPTTLSGQNAASPSDQGAIQNLICQELALSSQTNPTPSPDVKGRNQPLGFEFVSLGAMQQDLPSSTLAQESNSNLPVDQISTSHLDQESKLSSSAHDQHTVKNIDSCVSQSHPSSQSQLMGQTVRNASSTSLTHVSHETSSCDKTKKTSLSVSTLPGFKAPPVLSKLASRSSSGNISPAMNTSSDKSINLSMLDISKEPKARLSSSNVVNTDNTGGLKATTDEQTSSKNKRGRYSKRKAETDQALVMTGKRIRKALVKVSM